MGQSSYPEYRYTQLIVEWLPLAHFDRRKVGMGGEPRPSFNWSPQAIWPKLTNIKWIYHTEPVYNQEWFQLISPNAALHSPRHPFRPLLCYNVSESSFHFEFHWDEGLMSRVYSLWRTHQRHGAILDSDVCGFGIGCCSDVQGNTLAGRFACFSQKCVSGMCLIW